jgi:multiple sugar transport system permease protein
VDGASPWQQFTGITLPLLTPTLLVAALFRTLDAFRVFDLVYVMTGGGPGTATEPLALVTYATLLQHLQFGLGAALSMLMFTGSFLIALAAIRLFGRRALLEPAA